MGRQAETTIKVSTCVDVFYSGRDVDSVQGVKELESLEGAINEAGVVFRVDCVSCKRPGLSVL